MMKVKREDIKHTTNFKKGDIVKHNTNGEIGLVLCGKELLTLMLKSAETQDFIVKNGCDADEYHTVGHLEAFDEMLEMFDIETQRKMQGISIGDIAKNAWGTRGIVVGIVDENKISVQWKNMEDNSLHLSVWDREIDGVTIIGYMNDIEDLYNGTKVFDKLYDNDWLEGVTEEKEGIMEMLFRVNPIGTLLAMRQSL